LLSYLEENAYAFFFVSGSCVAVASIATLTGLRRCNSMRRVPVNLILTIESSLGLPAYAR
jgi:hypothetical protein